MQVFKMRNLAAALGIALFVPAVSIAQWTVHEGWGQINRNVWIGDFWDQCSNRNYGGVDNALTWPGGWDISGGTGTERRSYANYKGFVIGAVNVREPQYPDVIWPYMVGQRDGLNDGEQGADILAAAPDVNNPGLTTQILFKGRLARRTLRQAFPVVSVDGNPGHSELNLLNDANHPPGWKGLSTGWGGNVSDGVFQFDVVDPNIPADMTFETYPWTRMGVSNDRMWYAFVDRRNDKSMFWHWRLINDGVWGRGGVDSVNALWGAPVDTVRQVMFSLMFQWDRSSRGAIKTASSGTNANDSIWNYYGADYDATAPTEDMRLVWVRDGDQDVSKFPAYTNASTDDQGDPDPLTGEYLSAKDGGLLMLHFDRSTTDRRDDRGQPMTVGWVKYENLIHTGADGMAMKYNQMRWGVNNQSGVYYQGDYQETPLRGVHPKADAPDYASWIKGSNDPAVSGSYWPGKVLGVDAEVNDCEQQLGYGPKDIPPKDTLNMIYVLGVYGVDMKTCQVEGAKWLRGEITDDAKNELVFSAEDSLFQVMRQAKSVYQSATFADGYGSFRPASSRAELESAFGAAMTAGRLALSPAQPATFTVTSGSGKGTLAWTLNTSLGSAISGWRVYRAEASYKGDSVFTLIASLPAGATGYEDTEVGVGYSYYYYLTTYDANGNESMMHTRTSTPMVPTPISVRPTGRPLVFDLRQNAPNPFNPTTTIRFSIPEAGQTNLAIYSIDGRLIKTLVDGKLAAGIHEVAWDGTDTSGRLVSSGTYLYRLVSGSSVEVRRMVLIK